MTAVDVELGVTSIGDHAFNFMTNLKSATLPSDLTFIGYMAFRECTSLTSVIIPASVTMVESNAFYKCSSLVSVTFEGAQTAVYEDAFDNCSNGLVITGYAIDDAYHAVETPNSSVPYLCYSRHIPFNAVNGDLGAYTIDLTSGSAVLHDSVMDELRVIRASWGALRMLEERGTVAVPTENEGAYDLDKNGSPDVVLGFEYDPDDYYGDSMLATYTVAATNSVEGDKTFKAAGSDRYVATMYNPDGFYYSSLTFRFKATSVPIYRMYNTKTSEHLYTTNAKEYGMCGTGNYVDWNAEGVAWIAPGKDDYGATPVYRLYNMKSGDHHYTTSKGERDKLLAGGDWRDEGIAFYSADKANPGNIPVYRVYNGRLKRGQHHYTTSAGERDALVNDHGWRDEGIGFYGYKQ